MSKATRKAWTAGELAALLARYPFEATATIAADLGHSLASANSRAYKLGLKKNAEYLRAHCRIQPGDDLGKAYRFTKGIVPHNKGTRRPGWSPGRMKETQFKKGARTGIAAKNWRPIGTVLIDSDGYQRIKVREALPGEAYGFGNVRVWPQVHRRVWEAANGPIPAGHTVTFINGDKGDPRLENLQLTSRRELMARNSVQNLPKPLALTIQLLGALTRQIRKRTKAHDSEQDRTPAQPPLRDTRNAEGRGEADGPRPRASDR